MKKSLAVCSVHPIITYHLTLFCASQEKCQVAQVLAQLGTENGVRDGGVNGNVRAEAAHQQVERADSRGSARGGRPEPLGGIHGAVVVVLLARIEQQFITLSKS